MEHIGFGYPILDHTFGCKYHKILFSINPYHLLPFGVVVLLIAIKLSTMSNELLHNQHSYTDMRIERLY